MGRDVHIVEMTAADYDEARALWDSVTGVGLSHADTLESFERCLKHNPGLSFAARLEGKLVGVIVGSHDGLRGYLHHVAVHPTCRRQGIARALVQACLNRLREMGIAKCHIMVWADNDPARRFYEAFGWQERTDIALYSIMLTGPHR